MTEMTTSSDQRNTEVAAEAGPRRRTGFESLTIRNQQRTTRQERNTMNRIVKIGCLSLAAALLAAAPTTFAATATSDIAVSADVNNACTITGGALSFGAYTWGAEGSGSMNLTVKCTQGAGYDVALGAGGHAVSGQRKMSDGANFLNYALFSDNGTTPWNATTTVTGNGNGADQTLPVYGKIAADQSTVPASAGADYVDTVVATVVFTP
jgi:spore coat protein U domain-containing protein, fimbrial subunit CupE1/2/3/6